MHQFIISWRTKKSFLLSQMQVSFVTESRNLDLAFQQSKQSKSIWIEKHFSSASDFFNCSEVFFSFGKASSFLVLMKVYGSKIWNLYLYTSNRKYFKAKVEEIIKHWNFKKQLFSVQIFKVGLSNFWAIHFH